MSRNVTTACRTPVIFFDVFLFELYFHLKTIHCNPFRQRIGELDQGQTQRRTLSTRAWRLFSKVGYRIRGLGLGPENKKAPSEEGA